MARSIAALQIDSVFTYPEIDGTCSLHRGAPYVSASVKLRAKEARQNLTLQRTQVKTLPTLQSGERTNAAGKAVSNKILLSVPNEEYHAIRPCLEYLTLPSHLTLHEPSEKLEYAYFPNGGLVSLIVPMKDGQTVEAGVVGGSGRSAHYRGPDEKPGTRDCADFGRWLRIKN